MSIYSHRLERCRVCNSENLTPVLDLGLTPLSDRLLKESELDGREPFAPLELVFCGTCSLAQIAYSVLPELLFDADYPYYSSVSPRLVAHFGKSAQTLIKTLALDANSHVIEAASNDGCFLGVFKAAGIPVLGIDPSTGPAGMAQKAGIPTLTEFLTESLALRLLDDGVKPADLFLANNVLAHVPEVVDFVRAISLLLKPGGVAVFETPYLLDLLDNTEFDTIYHQHVFYYSVHALITLFASSDLYINSIQPLEIHGGSLRLTVSRQAVDDGSPFFRSLYNF
jgi:SAM-dependent methyltransferase